MTKMYAPKVSADNLSHESIDGIINIPHWLKKWGETLNVAFKCTPSCAMQIGFSTLKAIVTPLSKSNELGK